MLGEGESARDGRGRVRLGRTSEGRGGPFEGGGERKRKGERRVGVRDREEDAAEVVGDEA